ncbi:MAG: 50S ribosomal protein L24e [Candidatus Diapherotrites archaeon]|nr:50S ribosomal protein L24e [Candidatus Diapherotrites archaeon]
MVKCSFCKNEIEKGTGLIVVIPPGKAENYCSSKCEKNALKLKRNPRKVTWIQKGKKSK